MMAGYKTAFLTNSNNLYQNIMNEHLLEMNVKQSRKLNFLSRNLLIIFPHDVPQDGYCQYKKDMIIKLVVNTIVLSFHNASKHSMRNFSLPPTSQGSLKVD